MAGKLQSIYEYFKNYSKEEIDSVISKLSDKERCLIGLRYGPDLENPVSNSNWSREQNSRFYGSLIPKMKRLLNPNQIKKKPGRKTSIKTDTNQAIVEQDPVVNNKEDVKTESISMNLEDYIMFVSFFKTPAFENMFKEFTPEEAVIISLAFGYVNDKYFGIKEIADFLGMEESQVTKIAIDVLTKYRNKFNTAVDSVIDGQEKGKQFIISPNN